ncbi:type IV secretory system conjugative DNA transfer family protein, partial [Klebsiella pneumoniae]|uniref:type IV secretory system conjugative DNA transfer family protein n=1 Tax=Klebsiella pneumoniae TaxID=573 RepID=UPI00163D828F
LIIGATRCGKSRHVVLPSIGLTAMAGESMIVVDPKSELYLYTRPFLEQLGYEVIAIDFKEPNRGNCYNFLQPVLDAVYLGDLPLAVSCAGDI